MRITRLKKRSFLKARFCCWIFNGIRDDSICIYSAKCKMALTFIHFEKPQKIHNRSNQPYILRLRIRQDIARALCFGKKATSGGNIGLSQTPHTHNTHSTRLRWVVHSLYCLFHLFVVNKYREIYIYIYIISANNEPPKTGLLRLQRRLIKTTTKSRNIFVFLIICIA